MMPNAVWDAFVAGQPDGHILQTSGWGTFKEAFGWSWEIVTLGNGEPTAGALVLYRKLPLGLGTLAYVPRGPVLDWEDAGAAGALFAVVERAARRRRAWALWVEPNRRDTPSARKQMKRLGFRPGDRTVQPPRTILVDLAPEEDEVMAAMKQKTRYNVRLAGRKGVTVREGAPEDAALYYDLMTETGERDEFGIHSRAYYRRALEIFQPSGNAVLLLAEVEGEPVAGLIAFALGRTAWYFYGASSNRHREKMPTYALQWAAMQWARGRGCTLYDLWGVPDADEETLEAEFTERHDGLWGVYRFKRGFGGEVVRYVGLWEKSLNPLYPLAQKMWAMRTT